MVKQYYTAKEVQEILRLGHIRTAQLRVKKLNDELVAQGYWIEKGKVPVSFFHEKYPYIEKLETKS